MRYLRPVRPFLYMLRSLSLGKRLGLFLVSFLASLLFMSVLMMRMHNTGPASLIALPIALAAWLFSARGTFICVGSIFVILGMINILITKSLLWPLSLTVSFFTGMTITAFEAGCILFLRHALDIADKAKATLLHLNTTKDQFLFNVSHELRTPLTEVKGYIELLQMYQGQLDKNTQNIFLSSAVQACNELEGLVNNVLYAAHIDNEVDAALIENVNLVDMLQDLHKQMDHQEHPLTLFSPEDIIVRAERQQLRQVLRNLFSNAFKYSPLQTPVTVHVVQNGGSEVCIQVRDRGPGIASVDMPLLFQKFVRLERDMLGTARGTGLGLYICKRFIEGMGGRIWVESPGIAGEGSCFCITLPASSELTEERKKVAQIAVSEEVRRY